MWTQCVNWFRERELEKLRRKISATINLCKNSKSQSFLTHLIHKSWTAAASHGITIACVCVFVSELKGVASFCSRTFLKLTRSFEPFSPKNQFKRRHFVCSNENYRLHINNKRHVILCFNSCRHHFLALFHSYIAQRTDHSVCSRIWYWNWW